MSVRMRWGWIGVALLLACGALTAPAGATEEIIFGPTQYTRASGAPHEYRATITVPPTLVAPFRLHIETGDSHGLDRDVDAEIRLNGDRVARERDIHEDGPRFDRTVDLEHRNTLQVRLAGHRGEWVRLTLYGTIPPPTLHALTPPTLRITQGGHGTLTATISAVQPHKTRIHLESSHPQVAEVPEKVRVPAGALSVEIPVTAFSPGTTTITARLHHSHRHSTITVAPAGPTVTSLTPDTLQVTQGASGTLTLTLSAAQAHDTQVTLTSEHPGIVGLSSGTLTVPAGQRSQGFLVYGNSAGISVITAALNGSQAQSQVRVIQPLPTLVSLLPPILPLTEGSRGTLTVTLNASQPTDTVVTLTTDDPARVGLPGEEVIVPAGQLAVAFAVTGKARGPATVTASLNGSSATSAITVTPPPPTVAGLSCPGSLTLGATALCTVTLNATQLTETVVPLASGPTGILTLPETVTVPVGSLTAPFSITAAGLGPTTLTAGPLNGVSRSLTLQVVPPPPTLGSLSPASPAVLVGATVSLTLTLTAAAFEDTVVPLAWSPTGLLSGPAQVTVPASALTVNIPLQGLFPGTALVTVGPLNGTTTQCSVTVNQLPPTVQSLTPETLSLPKGKPGTLTVTIAPTQADPTGVPLRSSDPSVEVPGSITVPAGAATAEFPVLPRAEGSATVTAGPLNQSSQQALVTVTPAELLTLTLSPPSPASPLGKSEPFTATGAYTDGSSQDRTITATWTSSDETIATITPGGIATGHKEGQVTITATEGPVTGTATFTITPPVLASLAVSPAAPTRVVGQPVQFAATGTFTDGTTQDLTPAVTWSSSAPAVASISATGLALALAPGQSTITATHGEDFTASTVLTVILPPPTLTTFAPSSGPVGAAITLTGTNFASVQGVTFNGVAAGSVTVTSPTSLSATVPSGATTGPLAVKTTAGTATSSGAFVVLPTQEMSLAVEPGTVSAIAGTSVSVKVSTVVGGGFTGLTTLSLGPLPAGVMASFSTPALGPNAAGLLTLTTTGSTPSPVPIEIRGTTSVNGATITRTAAATLLVQAPGQTVLAGQIRDEEDQPLAGVSLRWGGNPSAVLGVTDAGGNFQVPLTLAGSQVFLLDGTTAGAEALRYATIPVTVTLQPGTVNGLGFLPRLHRQPPTQPLPVAPATATPVTFATLPDFMLTIPAGVSIIGWDGQANTQIGVRTVPLDRLALPAPPPGVQTNTVYMFSFGKVGGGTPTKPIPVTAPNTLRAYPGQSVELWYYNEAPDGSAPNAWEKFGTGTVSPDGRLIVSDPGVGNPRFCCGAWFPRVPPPPPNTPPDEQAQDPCPDPTTGTCKRADPIELSSGIFLHPATDLTLPGRRPIALTRIYRTNDPTLGPFGIGTSSSYDAYLREKSPAMLILFMPGNYKSRWAKQADASYSVAEKASLLGARLTKDAGGTWSLRFKDGSLWRFSASGWLSSQSDRNGNTLSLARDSQNRELTTRS